MSKIELSGTVSSWGRFSADYVKQELKKADGDITIEINSYGGSVFEGIEIFNALQNYDKGVVTTVNTSICASIASLIYLAGDKKLAHDNASIMIHKAWNIAWGNSEEMAKEVKILNSIDTVLAKTYNYHNSKTIDENMLLMSDETWYIGEEELLESGFVDEFIKTDKVSGLTSALAKNSYQGAINNYINEYQEHNPDIDFKALKNTIKECGGSCGTTAVMPSNEKMTNSKQGDAMEKELQAKLDKTNDDLVQANATIEGLQNSAKEGEKALKEVQDSSVSLDVVKEIVAKAIDSGVSAEIASEMIDTKSFLEAAKIANEKKPKSNGASHDLETPNNSAWKNIVGGAK